MKRQTPLGASCQPMAEETFLGLFRDRISSKGRRSCRACHLRRAWPRCGIIPTSRFAPPPKNRTDADNPCMSFSPRHAPVQFTAPDFDLVQADRARFKNAALAYRTVRSYESDWRIFNAWCKAARLEALPASEETVEIYVTDLIRRGRKITTVERHSVAIHNYHRDAGFESPCGGSLRVLFGVAIRSGETPALCWGSEGIRRLVSSSSLDASGHSPSCAFAQSVAPDSWL